VSPKLANVLSHIVARSTQSGKVERADLQNGLRVSVWVKPGRTLLYLSRERAYPSSTEWIIVTSNWPTPLAKAEFNRVQRAERFYLVGQVLTPVVTAEAEPTEAGHATQH